MGLSILYFLVVGIGIYCINLFDCNVHVNKVHLFNQREFRDFKKFPLFVSIHYRLMVAIHKFIRS